MILSEPVRRRIKLLTLAFFIICAASPLFALDKAQVSANAEYFKYWTLVPPFLAIALAFITRNVIFSLFLGVFSGTFLLELQGAGFLGSFFYGFLNIIDKILGSMADPWNAGIILQCLTIGGLIALISKMGGANAFS